MDEVARRLLVAGQRVELAAVGVPLDGRVVGRAHVATGVALEYLDDGVAEGRPAGDLLPGRPRVRVLGHAVHVVVPPDRRYRRGLRSVTPPEVLDRLAGRVASVLEALCLPD